MMVGVINRVIDLLDKLKPASEPWQQEQSRISDSKIIFKMKGMQQIAGKTNANIF